MSKAKKRIRFGGENLPAGTHTWYETLTDGKTAVVRAEVGHEVDADLLQPPNTAESFVARKMATEIE